MATYKITKEITHKFVFECKDKTTYPFKIIAVDEKAAREVIKTHLGEILDQIDTQERIEAKKEAGAAPKNEEAAAG